jgi:hypothetical protein
MIQQKLVEHRALNVISSRILAAKDVTKEKPVASCATGGDDLSAVLHNYIGSIDLFLDPHARRCCETLLPFSFKCIGHPSLLILEFVEGWWLAQPNFFAQFRIERGDALVGTNGKEKVIAAFHHPRQNRLYQAVVRIDQHVASLEAIEVKNELNHFKFSSPQQGVTKI